MHAPVVSPSQPSLCEQMPGRRGALIAKAPLRSAGPGRQDGAAAGREMQPSWCRARRAGPRGRAAAGRHAPGGPGARLDGAAGGTARAGQGASVPGRPRQRPPARIPVPRGCARRFPGTSRTGETRSSYPKNSREDFKKTRTAFKNNCWIDKKNSRILTKSIHRLNGKMQLQKNKTHELFSQPNKMKNALCKRFE